jgi:hypothetical protein
MRIHFSKILSRLAIGVLMLALLVPASGEAAQITARKLTLGSSAVSASTSYAFSFTLPSTTVLQGARFQICTTASGSCTTPTGWSNSGVTISQPTGLGDASGWTVDNATAGFLALNKSGNVAAPSNVNTTVTFSSVTNPNTANQTFYARITTYSTFSGGTYSGAVDTGTAASSTANQITFSGSVDETLTFCVGITVTGNCTSTSGTAVSFSTSSTFSPSAARTATSQFTAATNAGSGYVVTVNGSTLTCGTCSGSPTIAAMGTQSANGAAAASSTGSSQFGMNVVSNTSPTTFGANIVHATGASVGAAGTNYGTTNQYRFFTGDTVGTTGGAASDFDAYTASYIVNISGVQAAGTYTTTLTYICTATF